MAAFGCYVSFLEEVRLGKIGIEIPLHQSIRRVLRPADKMVHSPLWPVSVINLEPVTLRLYIVRDFFQSHRRLLRQKGDRLIISVNPFSNEVICAIVSYLQDGVRNSVGKKDKLFGIGKEYFFSVSKNMLPGTDFMDRP